MRKINLLARVFLSKEVPLFDFLSSKSESVTGGNRAARIGRAIDGTRFPKTPEMSVTKLKDFDLSFLAAWGGKAERNGVGLKGGVADLYFRRKSMTPGDDGHR